MLYVSSKVLKIQFMKLTEWNAAAISAIESVWKPTCRGKWIVSDMSKAHLNLLWLTKHFHHENKYRYTDSSVELILSWELGKHFAPLDLEIRCEPDVSEMQMQGVVRSEIWDTLRSLYLRDIFLWAISFWEWLDLDTNQRWQTWPQSLCFSS